MFDTPEPGSMGEPRGRRRRSIPGGLVGALTLAIVGGVLLVGAAPASAFPTKLSTNGQVDFAYGSAVDSAGGSGGTVYKPESKLFYTGDGTAEAIRWWAVLGTSGPSPAAGVWLYELVNHNWVARVQFIGADPWAKADALFQAGTLYVSTRDDKATSGGNQRQSSLYEIPYNGGGSWGSVQGPFAITTGTLETLTLARDSANRIWVTYESGDQIKVGYTAPGGTSFTFITVSKTNVKPDDISAVTAFGGNRIGVFWSDQNSHRDFFAWRLDSAPVTGSWTIETAFGGGVGNCPTQTSSLCSDDHMNLKVYQDQIYVAVKTSLNDASPNNPNDPITALLRRSSTGTWSSFPVATVSQNVTRPITVLSPDQNKIWVWGARGSEVDVWESSFTSPGFTSSGFIPWVKGSGSDPADATSTKQLTTAASGEVAMASDAGKHQYWHNEFLPGSAPANTPPTAHNVSTTATAGVAKAVTLTGTDAENCELTFNRPSATLPSGATVSAPTNAACTGAGPYQDTATVTYRAPVGFSGSDSFTYTVHDGTVGSNTATVSITVSAGTNQDPSFDQDLPNRTDAENAVILLSAHATDPENDTLTYAATGLPPGLSINTSTGLISGTISTGAAAGSPYAAHVTVSDDGGATTGDTDTFSWTVTSGGGGGGPITLRSASTGANNVGNNVVIPVPAGVQSGDVMVAVVDVKASPSVGTPAGWTLVSDTANGSNFRQLVYTRVAAGGEPASYQWSYGENRAASGAILAYIGVNTANPVETFSAGTGTTTSITAPSVTSAFDGAMIVGAFGINADSTIAPPPGMTERGEIVSATRLRTEVCDVALSSSGATGDKTATAATAAANIGQLIALRPA
jgi:hypothetical protein